MNSSTDDELLRLLSDIIHWGERTERHVAGLSLEDFAADISKCDSVCWCIVCIGEASGKIRQIRPEMAAQNPALELAKANAMRNRIAHGYDGIDIGVLWQAATISVPALVLAARSAADALRA